MTPTDIELLRDYAEKHSEPAFAALVQRHLNLVFSAALRQVRSPQLAEEVAQSVFADLARNAAKLKPGTILTAWLYEVARRTAIDVIRREARRQLREQIATEMNAANATASDWTHIEPLLDDAMHALDGTDRAAILLRYFENKSLREVGATLGTSDDAAQKRVTRAVERLREHFAKHGVTTGAAGLAAVISANAVQAAPPGLAITISAAAALAGAGVATTAIATATKTLAMTALQKTIFTTTIAVLAGAGIYESRQASRLREQVQILQQQEAPLSEEVAQLQHQRDDAARRLAGLAEELANAKEINLDLLRLRGEVARLRSQTNQLASQQKAAAQRPAASENEAVAGELVPRAKYAFAGFAEPKSTVNSIFWAMSQGDVRTLLASMSPALRSQTQVEWNGKTEDEIKTGLLNDSDNRSVTAYRITRNLAVSENEVVLTIFQEGRNREKMMRLVRVGEEWRFAGTPGR